MAEGVTCLKGNHEAMLLGELPVDERRQRAYRLDETRRLLDPTTIATMRALSPELTFQAGGRTVLLVHGSPDGPLNDYLYPDAALELIRRDNFDLCFMGHTHRPCDRSWGGRRFVNVGSCGQPRDHGGMGSVCLFDVECCRIELLRFETGCEAVAAIERVGGVDPAIMAMLERRPESELVGEVVYD
jgi:predicted phosphodiesterase